MRDILRRLGVALPLMLTLLLPSRATASPITVTVSGTIQSGAGQPDTALLFGAPIESLLGLTYTETITTDPSFDSQEIRTSTDHEAYGGGQFGSAAPYTLAVTVNGTTYTQSDSDPFWNRTYLLDVTNPNFMNQIDQEVQSSGCAIAYGFCVTSYMNPYSLSTPFLQNLNFNHPLTVSGNELDPGSSFLFTFRDGPTALGSINQVTGFTGSVSSISIRAVPEPSSLGLLLTGIGGCWLGVKRRRPEKH